MKKEHLLICYVSILLLSLFFTFALAYDNEYSYVRDYDAEDGRYDIRLDTATKNLAEDVGTEFPDKKFRIRLHNTDCVVSFENALSAGEQSSLDTVVATHKAE